MTAVNVSRSISLDCLHLRSITSFDQPIDPCGVSVTCCPVLWQAGERLKTSRPALWWFWRYNLGGTTTALLQQGWQQESGSKGNSLCSKFIQKCIFKDFGIPICLSARPNIYIYIYIYQNHTLGPLQTALFDPSIVLGGKKRTDPYASLLRGPPPAPLGVCQASLLAVHWCISSNLERPNWSTSSKPARWVYR